MKRFKIAGFALAALVSAAFAAHRADAQTSTSTSGAASGANAISGSNSTSVSGATGGNSTATNSATNAAGASTGPASVNFSTGNNSPYTVNNPGDVTIRSAPQVYVPSVITGNVCALGASAGASWLGAGFAVGTSWESAQCENRHRVALLYNMGEKAAAKEVLCDTKEVYEGFKRTGNPCVVRPEWEPKNTVSQLPAQRPVAPVAAPAPRMAFNAAMYATGADCLNAASAAGASLSECAGKR
jgi:hypothetical protein